MAYGAKLYNYRIGVNFPVAPLRSIGETAEVPSCQTRGIQEGINNYVQHNLQEQIFNKIEIYCVEKIQGKNIWDGSMPEE